MILVKLLIFCEPADSLVSCDFDESVNNVDSFDLLIVVKQVILAILVAKMMNLIIFNNLVILVYMVTLMIQTNLTNMVNMAKLAILMNQVVLVKMVSLLIHVDLAILVFMNLMNLMF